MTYVLDTDVAIDCLRNKGRAPDFINANKDLAITSHTLAELSYGVHLAEHKRTHVKKLFDFLAGFTLLGFGCREALLYGEIKKQLRGKGKLCGDFDIAIAATCISNDAVLVTRNLRHYQQIRELDTRNLQ